MCGIIVVKYVRGREVCRDMAKVMVATSIRLEPEVHERLMAIASGRGVSVSSLLRAAIDRVVEEETEV